MNTRKSSNRIIHLIQFLLKSESGTGLHNGVCSYMGETDEWTSNNLRAKI